MVVVVVGGDGGETKGEGDTAVAVDEEDVEEAVAWLSDLTDVSVSVDVAVAAAASASILSNFR